MAIFRRDGVGGDRYSLGKEESDDRGESSGSSGGRKVCAMKSSTGSSDLGNDGVGAVKSSMGASDLGARLGEAGKTSTLVSVGRWARRPHLLRDECQTQKKSGSLNTEATLISFARCD